MRLRRRLGQELSLRHNSSNHLLRHVIPRRLPALGLRALITSAARLQHRHRLVRLQL